MSGDLTAVGELRSYFGGMGSLNDIGLSSQVLDLSLPASLRDLEPTTSEPPTRLSSSC